MHTVKSTISLWAPCGSHNGKPLEVTIRRGFSDNEIIVYTKLSYLSLIKLNATVVETSAKPEGF